MQELKDELEGGSFEDDALSQIDDEVQSGINSMLLESGDDESFQEELERELGRPYKSAREAAADMLQVGSTSLGTLAARAHEPRAQESHTSCTVKQLVVQPYVDASGVAHRLAVHTLLVMCRRG